MHADKQNIVEQEIQELKNQIESFQKEKDRIRAIVGQIGGMPSSTKKIYELMFTVLVIGALIAALFLDGVLKFASIEAAIALLSLKIIYLMRNQARVNHFQLWILTSLEWRINEIMEKLNGNDDPSKGQEL